MNLIKAKNNVKVSKIKNHKFKDNFELFTMALPGYILIFVFCYLPMFGVIIAFKEFNPNLGILASKWVGFDNFKFFFQSNDFIRIMRNTIGYSVIFLVLDNTFPILLAYAFYNVKKRSLLKYYQTAGILPHFLSMVLVSYIVYTLLSPNNGMLNQLLVSLGGAKVDWYSEPAAWPFILSITHLWKSIGMACLIYYALMVGIDESLFEAARIDGATKWHQLRYIIIPELSALIALHLIMGVGHLVSGDFGLNYQVPLNVGVLYPTTDIIQTYTFRALQEAASLGRTAAVGLFSSVTGTILLLCSNAVIRKVSPENSMF